MDLCYFLALIVVYLWSLVVNLYLILLPQSSDAFFLYTCHLYGQGRAFQDPFCSCLWGSFYVRPSGLIMNLQFVLSFALPKSHENQHRAHRELRRIKEIAFDAQSHGWYCPSSLGSMCLLGSCSFSSCFALSFAFYNQGHETVRSLGEQCVCSSVIMCLCETKKNTPKETLLVLSFCFTIGLRWSIWAGENCGGTIIMFPCLLEIQAPY